MVKDPVLLERCVDWLCESRPNIQIPKVIELALMGSRKRILDYGSRYPQLLNCCSHWTTQIDFARDTEFWERCLTRDTLPYAPAELWSRYEFASRALAIVLDQHLLTAPYLPEPVQLFLQTLQHSSRDEKLAVLERNHLQQTTLVAEQASVPPRSRL